MGAVELAVILFLLLKGGASGFLKPSPTPVPSPSTPQPGPVPATSPAHPPVATAPPPGQATTPQQHQAQTQAASAPHPFPQATPPGLPPFPGPGWKPFIPTPSSVVVRANQLLPVLWAIGAGARKIEQTAGQWAAYVASPGPAGRKDVHAFKLVSQAPLANA